mmetsp:Transcript_17270/g.24947  ORF Transcript_17270/g.24947 Transcript_17270/m.24947 type:complete len:135 (-) Transcript_17270:262-666(-)
MTRSLLSFLFLTLFACGATAFVSSPKPRPALVRVEATKNSHYNRLAQIVTTATIAVATSPLVALAEEVSDEYEYGAVNAPIGIAWGAGVLAILTALLPIAMQGGEEAFEEMKSRDSPEWGSGKTPDVLSKNRRK